MNTSWSNVIGHEKNIASLKRMYQEGRVPHSLMFCGPEGVGKVLIAEAFATLLLCHDSHDGTPCGVCPSCQRLAKGTHPDFFQVAPQTKEGTAPSIKIDQIRQMQSDVARVPILSPKRVVIIDQADTMNEAAENCLLKTIEEPEGQTYFILVTSSVSHMLPTTLSRCMREEFGPLGLDELKAVLRKQGIGETGLGLMADYADGSVGQAMLLSEESSIELRNSALSFVEDTLKGDLKPDRIWSVAKPLYDRDKQEVTIWLSLVAMVLRDILVLFSGSQLRLYNQQEIRRLSGWIENLSQPQAMLLLKLVKDYQHRIKSAVNLRLMVESFIIRFKNTMEE